MFRTIVAGGALLAACSAVPAQSASVSLVGGVLNSCVLTPAVGTLAIGADGTTLSSESGLGALPATLGVVATGTAPTLTFGVPSLTGPVSSATTEIRYDGLNASQAYTSGSSTASARLIDLFTIHARITSATGFGSGTYTVTTIVTCGQS